MKVYIVGAGPGAEDMLTAEARRIISSAGLVVTTQRLFESLGHLNKNTVCRQWSELAECIQDAGRQYADAAILVSGDSGFFSASKLLRERLQGMEIEIVGGISSLQYLCSKCGISYEDAKCISLHGRDRPITPFVSYNPKVFALTGGDIRAQDALAELYAAGLGQVRAIAGENLSAPDERIVKGTVEGLQQESFGNLACILLLNDNFTDAHAALRDSDFIRNAPGERTIPMTKQAVRTLALAALGIRPGDTVADIGAGTGSASIEMARKACEGMVYSIEKNEAAFSLLRKNRERLGAFNIVPVSGIAPVALDGLPVFHKAFVGGSSGNLDKIVPALAKRNPAVKIAVTAITLETLQEAVAVFSESGFGFEVSCINVARSARLGPYTSMQAENPVYIICGEALES